MTGPVLDCIIIGGGPAGLTAALYLARFRRKVCVIDAGESRAAWIPVSHNQPLFPAGITGTEILGRMRQHLTKLATEILTEKAIAVARIHEGFLVDFAEETAAARTLLLATGVVNHRPDMSAQVHRDAVAAGLIRYCPVCDGFEAKGQKIVVLGKGPHGVREAVFLRTYSQDVTLISASAMNECSSRQLAAAGVSLIEQPIARLTIDQGKF
jgi:thioredoxin reductase (NADPH)